MTSDSMTLHDLAAAEMFVSSADRIGRTFEVIRTLEPARGDLGAGNFHGPDYDGSGGVVWGWFFLREPQKIQNDWHFAWGIRFPLVSEWWLGCEPPLPAVPHAFLTLTAERSDFPLSALRPEDIPPGWQITPEEEDLVVAKPLHEFRADADGLAADFGEWVAASMKSARPILALLIKAVR